MKHMLGKAKQ